MNKVPWWHTEIGESEKAEVLSAFDKRLFSMGRNTDLFEKKFSEFLEVPHAVMTNSGTSALTMALLAAGVGPGDEVIVPALTWIATANAVSVLGAHVILVDCHPDDPLLDIAELKKKITSRTKAIVPVHLNGRACPMSEIIDLADRNGIIVIEDSCKALASKTESGYLGTFGSAGCYSLGMISLVSIGYGGVVVTEDHVIAERLQIIRNQGVPYTEVERYDRLGFNFKVSDILAGIGLAQLRRIDEKKRHVTRVYERYVEELSDIASMKCISVDVSRGHLPLCVEFRSPHREAIIRYLKAHGVEALRFHLPLNRAKHLGAVEDCPNAATFSGEGFILPCGPSQPMQNVDYCVGLLQRWKPS